MVNELNQLDKILKLFFNTENRILSMKELYQKLDLNKNTAFDLPAMIMKIVEDQYLGDISSDKTEKDNPSFILTFKGLLFIKYSGYKRQWINEKIKIWVKIINMFVLCLAATIAMLYYYHELTKEPCKQMIPMNKSIQILK